MSKLTSLSAQLKRLQVPQGSLLSQASERSRASFLYEPREAANMDSEAVFCVAMNGLEQLKSIDAATFESFEQTLFSSTSVTFERAVQSKQVNVTLDAEIRRFMLHLSPYFMLKPAHKAFEWLVYRYQVHVYNPDEMLMCLLPYHETNYFVRGLQLLSLESNKLWSWLVENQKKGVSLAASALATHAFSDIAFCNYLLDYQRQSIDLFIEQNSNSLQFVFGFFTKTFLQAVKQLSLASASSSRRNHQGRQQEAFFAQLLPALFAGFKSDLIVYKQASYLIASFLFEKFKFNEDTVHKTLFCLAKGLSTLRDLALNGHEGNETEGDCKRSATLAICLIAQSQPSDSIFTKAFIKKLLKNVNAETLLSLVDSIAQSYRVDRFLSCFFKRVLVELIEHDEENKDAFNAINVDLDAHDDEAELNAKAANPFADLMLGLVKRLNLNRSPDLVQSMIDDVFAALLSQVKDPSHNQLPNLLVEFHLCQWIAQAEAKYPARFDSSLERLLARLSTQHTAYFLNTVSCKFPSLKSKASFKFQQLEDASELNLLLALTHSKAAFRSNGLQFLLNQIQVIFKSLFERAPK